MVRRNTGSYAGSVLSTQLFGPFLCALEPGSVHGLPHVHPEQGPSQHGPGPLLPRPDDPPAGARPGPGGRGRHRLRLPAQHQGDGQGEGEDPQVVRHGAQQASGPGEHHRESWRSEGLLGVLLWEGIQYNRLEGLEPELQTEANQYNHEVP